MKKQKPKKSTKTSKPKRGPGRPATGVAIRLPREYLGQDPHLDVHPPVKEDSEVTMPAPTDKASKHKYPPPKKNKIFRDKWMQFIDNVTKRENFNIAHLNALEVLCDLFVEYDDLQTFIRKHGRNYKSIGRMGLVWKFYPEVVQLNKTQGQIRDYMKMLGLLLKKDHGTESGGEAEEWK